MRKNIMSVISVFCFIAISINVSAQSSTKAFFSTYNFTSDGYIKAVEMNIGDTLAYKLKNGQLRTFILRSTSAKPIFTYDNPDNNRSGIVYSMNCKIMADGQELNLKRIVSAQQSYYKPWHINGVTFFFDAVKVIDTFIKDNHGSTGGSAYPKKDVRFAFIEYEDDYSPQPLKPWYPNKKNYINIKDAYEGADSWLGGYRKDEAHNGLDINISNNTPLWAPIDFDDQYYFNSLAKGDNNNRWMGVRTWPNGEKWILRTHHMTALNIEQNTTLTQGQFYGTVGGVLFGSYPHVHFYFIWEKDGFTTALDPWMIFWKTFENNKRRSNQIRAVMNPFIPAKVGERISINGTLSEMGIHGSDLKYFWSVNNGAFYEGSEAEHVFIKEGVYIVTLTVTNGTDTSTVNQYITVNGGTEPNNYLRLKTMDPFGFKVKAIEEAEIYGQETKEIGNILRFFFKKNSEYIPLPKEVVLEGNKLVLESLDISIDYLDYSNWLKVEKIDNKIKVTLLKENLSIAKGTYKAKIILKSAKTGINQSFYVEATTSGHRYQPLDKIIVDDKQAVLFPSNYYWIEEPFDKEYLKGYGSVTFWGGGNVHQGIARYQPELSGGSYKIYLHEDAIYEPKYSVEKSGIIHLQIYTVNGVKDLFWNPRDTNIIGVFELFGGKDSYVDIVTTSSTGMIYLDALVFEKIIE